jgi:hypothetical protein
MNALAHCAEALYTTGRAEETDPEALAGEPACSRAGCRSWSTAATTSRRGEACSRGRCTPAPAFRKPLPVALAARSTELGAASVIGGPFTSNRMFA